VLVYRYGTICFSRRRKNLCFFDLCHGSRFCYRGAISRGRERRHHSTLAPFALIFGLFVFMTAIAPTLYFAIFSLVAVALFQFISHRSVIVTLQLESDQRCVAEFMALWTIAFLRINSNRRTNCWMGRRKFWSTRKFSIRCSCCPGCFMDRI